jgi:IclR family mhp operon transcriptional activator
MEHSSAHAGISNVRALERGLDVLEFLRDSPPVTLEAVHRGTGLPKTTALRILTTLARRGMVHRGLSDGRYRIGTRLHQLSSAMIAATPLADAALPVLDRLCREIGWPSDLAVRRGIDMELVETSRAISSISSYRDSIGGRVPMLISAVGRAHLAFCPDAEREALLGHIETSTKPWNQSIRNIAALRATLAQTRDRGYAERDPFYSGWHLSAETFDDELLAIAVPVLGGPTVLGCINVVWQSRHARVTDMAERHLSRMQAAAAEIAAAAVH